MVVAFESMANSFFQFKHFTIQQAHCAMKVCTDACLFGAWAAEKLHGDEQYILDIGTGTGLLALLLAQQSSATIDAIEIDVAAAKQASENFMQSRWQQRLSTIHADVQTLKPSHKYDFIICNPPFFANHLKSPGAGKNLAKHQAQLTLTRLPEIIAANLSARGRLALLLAHSRSNEALISLANNDFHVHELVNLRQTPTHAFFRSMIIAGYQEKEIVHADLSIKNEQGDYSAEFVRLLKDYYLYL